MFGQRMSNALLNFLARTKPYAAGLWLILALAACAEIWTAALSRVESERERADTLARQQAGAYAEAYEQYITRSMAQMDQITMQLKHSWEYSPRPALLEDMKKDGMFTDAGFVWVGILDRNGSVVSSTRPAQTLNGFANADFFLAHRDSNSTALRVGKPPASLAHGMPSVLFTRRLERSGDNFDGLVVMAIDAGYFTSFVSGATLGPDGVLAMMSNDGRLRVEQLGGGRTRTGIGDAVLPTRQAPWTGDTSVRLVDAADGKTRVLGWHRSAIYPVVALVGLSHDKALAGVERRWRESRMHVIAATMLLVVAGICASLLSRRAQTRSREQDEIRQAYRTATESANDGFYMAVPVRDRTGTIHDFKIVDCNERGAYFYRMRREELIGSRVSQLDPTLHHSELVSSYKLAMASGFHEEDRRMPPEAQLNIQWGHRRLVRVGNGLAVTLQDITARKTHEEQLERLANEDALTKLPNRHWLLQFLPQELSRLRQDHGGAALLFVDLDDFKQVNDTHGHAAGDRLLKAAAQRLVSLLRPTERVARFGGDEFIVLLSPCASEQQAMLVAQRIVAAFAEPFQIGEGLQAAIGASVGISLYPRHGDDASALIRNADMAMYVGKNDGKGQHRLFDHTLSSTLRKRTQLRLSLVEAIDGEQFLLHFQPRVATETGELLSMEALLRWHHPELGTVPPGEFIPLAESTGLILPIGKIVIDKACAQLAAWRDAGLPLVPLSVNVSPKQFSQASVARELAAALARHAIPAHLLEVEITESAMLADHGAVLAELDAIRALGIKLHIDDFGTGYSSLSQLQRLRMDVLKVDRAFTAQLCESKEGRVFFQAIMSMAHALSMSVVAEGVETAEQLQMLKALQCDEVQGFLIARPMDDQTMGETMRQRYLVPALFEQD